MAGVGSALGFFTAPVAFDLTRSHRVRLEDADFGEIETLFQTLEKRVRTILQKTIDDDTLLIERTLMMRFVGQGAETDLPMENKPFHEWKIAEIRHSFRPGL